MRFIYGRSDWPDVRRGEENGYLLTNGLGGFSSATMIGSSARSDHSFFMACVKAPNHRFSMVHRLEEVLEQSGTRVHLSSQRYTDEAKNEEGYRFLDSFCFEDYPRWLFHADGVEVEKEIAMKQGENVIAVRYRIENRTNRDVTLKVTPHLQFCPKGKQPGKGREFTLMEEDGYVIRSDGMSLYFSTNGEVRPLPLRMAGGLYYAYDACDGRPWEGITYVCHQIEKGTAAGSCGSLEIVYRMDPGGRQEVRGDGVSKLAAGIFEHAVRYREDLAQTSGFQGEMARTLAKSAGQFVAERESTKGKTILAGFPFFEDWGRDTMIAVAGCCISTRQFETAKSILRTFAAYCREGLMPNLFPEGGNEPMYNTVDASLLFIHAVYLYYKKRTEADGLAFAGEMWPTMCGIIDWYRRGTSFGIHMDEDGLLAAGLGLDQVTWMDVRINDILPTPRHGKPVEVNAYWYNALCVMGFFAGLQGRKECGEDHAGIPGRAIRTKEEFDALARKTGASFREKFWNEEKSCLRDVLSEKDEPAAARRMDGKKACADEQIRCSQIWAVSMPFCALDPGQQKSVVDTVFEKLYTPYGLRTLAKDDPEFHGRYGGPQMDRDLAYHQGTVWVFPLGAYYLAYLRTRQYSREALETVRRQLEPIESALREGCAGQLPELYDGEFPSVSRGCFAQAWSVGEMLRVYEALEEHGL